MNAINIYTSIFTAIYHKTEYIITASINILQLNTRRLFWTNQHPVLSLFTEQYSYYILHLPVLLDVPLSH